MIKSFFKYYKPYRLTLVGVICGSLLTSGLDLVFPLMVRKIMNEALPNNNLQMLINIAIVLLTLYVINFIISYCVSYYGHIMGARIENDMRRDLYSHLQKMSFKFFDNTKTGQLISRLTGDISEIGELAFRGPNDVIVCGLTMLGTITMLLYLNLKLGLVIGFLLLLKTYHTVVINRKMKKAFRANRAKNGEVTAQAQEGLSGIRIVKAFAQEENELTRFMEKSWDFFESRKKSYKLLAYFGGSVNFFTNITNLAILVIGGYMIAYNEIAISDFIAFLLYSNLFMRPIFRLMMFAEALQRGMAGYERFTEIIDEEPEIADAKDAIDVVKLHGDIEFKDVEFGYGTPEPVIKDFNLKIKQGETVAFVGETGAGKTTISSLLLRFYELQKGSITIDGVNINQYTQNCLRSNIGIVQQDVFLFSDSVLHNIAYAKPDASAHEIELAAKSAAAEEFILNLPEKYDTEIGERGVKLSGGQKQRIAIARVFLKNPPIVILDEATSSLDNKTEKMIQESLDKLSANRTTLIIAHRMSTVKNADKIVVVNNGQVVELGTHNELMAQGGIYYKLYTVQKNQGNQ